MPLLFSTARNPERGPVLDPFCGAGTVGAAAVTRGMQFLGVEAHPEIAELARLKLSPLSGLGSELLRVAQDVVTASEPWDARNEPLLVRRCFAADTLAVLVGLRESVRAAPGWAQPYLKWALLGTLRDVANVRVGWPYLRPSVKRTPPYRAVKARMLERCQWIHEDLVDYDPPDCEVLCGDAGRTATWQTERIDKASVCLTSPPYLNNFDYADATRLELFFWGSARTWREMCDGVREPMIIATTQQSSIEAADRALERLRLWPELRAETLRLVRKLELERLHRPGRGKEYDRVLPSYLLGIVRVLEQIAPRLEPDAWCGWVVGDSAPYGVYVDTPRLIRLAARSLGFHGGQSRKLRERGLRWRTNGTRHQVPLDERLVWFRAPGV